MNPFYDAEHKARKAPRQDHGCASPARAESDGAHTAVVGLRNGSASRHAANEDGIEYDTIDSAARRADIVMMLAPDEEQPAIYADSIRDNMRPGAYLGFAHGFAIHFGTIVPPENVNVFMVAPKAPGRLVRSEYEAGRGSRA